MLDANNTIPLYLQMKELVKKDILVYPIYRFHKPVSLAFSCFHSE